MLRQLFISTSLFITFTRAVNEADQVTAAGFDILRQSEISGVSVRQCSCIEQNECVQEMKSQLLGCVDSCWYTFGQITQRPDMLRTCVTRKDDMLQSFFDCVTSNLDACVNTPQGPLIPKRNIREIFRIGEEKIDSQRKALMGNAAVRPLQNLVETTFRFGKCVKDCFLNKNAQGFCFDRKNCQPLITEARAKKTLKTCLKGLDWKSEAGELCECALGAGVSELKDYCPMLRLVARTRNHRG